MKLDTIRAREIQAYIDAHHEQLVQVSTLPKFVLQLSDKSVK